MIHFLPAIWVFPEQLIVYRIGLIGRGCIRMFALTWRHVLFVWPGSLRVPGGLPCEMLMWGSRWDLLDMSVTIVKGNRYVLVMMDCFSRWTEACPLPDKTALAVADAFFQHIVCRFGMPSVIHSDQGREFENKVIPELCLLCGAHKTCTTPYHPESDGLVERFNRTLPMMLAMFAGENRDDWDDLLPAVMMAYRS